MPRLFPLAPEAAHGERKIVETASNLVYFSSAMRTLQQHHLKSCTTSTAARMPVAYSKPGMCVHAAGGAVKSQVLTQEATSEVHSAS